MTWQPIETAPRDGTTVLAWCDEWKHARTAWAYESDQWQAAPPSIFQPTHWMPLPAPPEAPDER
jgi:hypothetical protein